jgi:regulatory protein
MATFLSGKNKPRKRAVFKQRVEAPRKNLGGGRVTGLEPQVKRPNRFNLYVDDHFALGLSLYVASRVRVGQDLSSEELQELERAEQLEEAHERALRALESRPRSEQEIRRKLIEKKFPTEIIAQVITRLNEARLLSDRDFAKFWVETREGFKPRSARALKYELRQKGVPPEEIARALKKIDEPDSAYRAARPKAERWTGLEEREFREKLSGFLARRGFDYQITRETVSKIWKELNGKASEDVWSDE